MLIENYILSEQLSDTELLTMCQSLENEYRYMTGDINYLLIYLSLNQMTALIVGGRHTLFNQNDRQVVLMYLTALKSNPVKQPKDKSYLPY